METTYRSQLSTSVLIPNRFDSKQRHTQTHAPRADASHDIPPSPTLTNPDMILPDDGERQSLTPSPPFQLSSSDTHMLQNGLDSTGGGSYYHSNQSAAQNLGGAPIQYRPPRSRWTYESHAHGRPLSDIGEEDYQPSLTGNGSNYSTEQYSGKSDSGSDDSGSTISASSQQNLALLTTGPRGHENGTDSKRSSYASQSSIERARAQASDALISEPPQSSSEESSSAILSSEAERILENAKRRLTLMEGNLTRARTSVRLSQTPSPSFNSAGSSRAARNLQPAGELYRSISQTDRRSSLLRPRPVYTATYESGHSRGRSETNLPLTEYLQPHTIQPSRSMSALASPSASQYETDEQYYRYYATANNGYHQAVSGPSSPMGEAHQADEYHRSDHHGSDINGSSGLGISAAKANPKMSSMEDFNSAYPQHDPPSRAQSQLQVRDLKDQAAGLRTKVALLKVKTQEDNLRRRSLQSLRTPSPFTAADRWYSSELEHGSGGSSIHDNADNGWTDEAAAKEEEEYYEHRMSDDIDEATIDAPAESYMREVTSQPVDDEFIFESNEPSLLESRYEDAEEGEYDEGGIDREGLKDTINEAYSYSDDEEDDSSDVFEDFDSTPHEEREDAFDYENFYLHSALGTFSRQKMRRRSYNSTGSNETTRPSHDNKQGNMHNRNASSDSISTLATFATATENAYDDDQEDALRAIDQLVDAWQDDVHIDVDDDASTPVQNRSRRTTVVSRVDESRHVAAALGDNSPLTPTKTLSGTSAGRDVQTPTTPVDTFMSSLSSRSTTSRPPSSLKADDTRLLEQVFQSLGKVCTELQELTLAATASSSSSSSSSNGGASDLKGNSATPPPDPKYIRTLRRRLDAARRVLDGQLDSDA